MSTILRALKKAEQASMESHSIIDDNVGFKSRDREDDKPAPKRLSRQGKRWIAFSGVGLVLAAVIYYLGLPNMSSLLEKAPAPIVEKEDKGPSGTGPTKPGLPPKALPAPPVLSRQPFDPKTLPAPVAKKTVLDHNRPAQRVWAKPPPEKEKIEPGKTIGPSPVQNDDIRILEPENLKLQAISWSKTPSARVVVINSRVLGEKDTIEGYEILTINKNDIILSDGSAEKIRLVFKNR